MRSSWGSTRRNSCTTESPPTPESNTPSGAAAPAAGNIPSIAPSMPPSAAVVKAGVGDQYRSNKDLTLTAETQRRRDDAEISVFSVPSVVRKTAYWQGMGLGVGGWGL